MVCSLAGQLKWINHSGYITWGGIWGRGEGGGGQGGERRDVGQHSKPRSRIMQV